MVDVACGLSVASICSFQPLPGVPGFIQTKKGARKMKYRVHRFDIKMTRDQGKLERFLNSLDGEVVAIVPNIAIAFYWAHRVNFLLIVEKVR